MKIPFNKIYYSGKELEYISDALLSKEINADGKYTKLVSKHLEEKFNIKKLLMTTSCTHALEMAAMLVGIQEGDEVIMPSFTFPSTANAIMLHGGKPVFVDVLEDTLNIDPIKIERSITNKTKAIIPVHYGGVGCKMDEIMDIAKKHQLYVIEDSAQGVNASYRDKYLGTWGHIGCYSFHGTKNYISGEGGALAINTDDEMLIKRAEIIRQKGTNRFDFLRGHVDKYTWVDVGSSYGPSDVLMAMLYSQIQDIDDIKIKRKYISERYDGIVSKYIDLGKVKSSSYIPRECDSNYHIYYMVLNSIEDRDRVITRLAEKDISAYTHFMPLHTSDMGKKLGYRGDEFPVTLKAGDCLLRLPLYTHMKPSEIEYVIKVLNEILKEL